MHTHKFKNDLQLIYEKPNNSLPISVVYCFVDLGSIYEHDGIRGSSHFIEHMCFKGTRKIASSKVLSSKFDKVGAFFNAFTTKEYTCYTVKCQDHFVENCIEILGDMMMNSVFQKQDLEKERKVVMEETIKNEDSPDDTISKEMESMLYAGSSFADPIDTITYHTRDALPYDKIVEIYKAFYRPERFVLSVVSQISFNQIRRFISTSDFMKTRPQLNLYDPTKWNVNMMMNEIYENQYKIVKKKGITATYIDLGFRTCPNDNDDKYVLEFLSNILGGIMSSRLFVLLREENGLTYSSYANTTHYKNGGDFSIYTMANHEKIIRNGASKPGVLPLLIQLLNDLVNKGITLVELEKIKGNMSGTAILDLEDSANQASHNGLNLILFRKPDEIVPYNQLYRKYYGNITKKMVDGIIRKYFVKDRMFVVLMGENPPSLKDVKKCCSNFCSAPMSLHNPIRCKEKLRPL